MIDPIIRWLGGRINGLVDDKMRTNLDKKLTLAGDPLGLVPEELVALCVMSGFLGVFGGILANEVAHVGFPIVAACAIIGGMLPTSALSEAMATRYKAINRGLPHAIDLLALGMGAGLDFPAAVRQIVENSGTESSMIVGKLLEQKSANYGWDAQNERYADFIESGIVDPTKVVRIALQNASSVASLLITTEAMVADRPKKDSPPMPHGGGGMGDMDF
jgi:hypothetical protein